MNKKNLLVIPFILALSACGAPSVESLKSDKALLEDTMHECQQMKPSEAREDDACKNAAEAYQQLIKEGVDDAMKNMNDSINGMLGK